MIIQKKMTLNFYITVAFLICLQIQNKIFNYHSLGSPC